MKLTQDLIGREFLTTVCTFKKLHLEWVKGDFWAGTDENGNPQTGHRALEDAWRMIGIVKKPSERIRELNHDTGDSALCGTNRNKADPVTLYYKLKATIEFLDEQHNEIQALKEALKEKEK